MKVRIVGFCIALIFVSMFSIRVSAQNAQQDQEAYTKVITERASKITATLGITDSTKFYRVNGIIAGQYRALNDIYMARDAKTKAIKDANADNKDAAKTQLAALDQEVTASVDKQHAAYLLALAKELTPGQVDKVKDGMTYNVRNVTYKAYTQMLPDLSAEQKQQIMDWLVEAREHSMDAESSQKKHAWFGKYKGRINNYLSKAGIDMKKAEEDWQKRIKEEQNNKAG